MKKIRIVYLCTTEHESKNMLTRNFLWLVGSLARSNAESLHSVLLKEALFPLVQQTDCSMKSYLLRKEGCLELNRTGDSRFRLQTPDHHIQCYLDLRRLKTSAESTVLTLELDTHSSESEKWHLVDYCVQGFAICARNCSLKRKNSFFFYFISSLKI